MPTTSLLHRPSFANPRAVEPTAAMRCGAARYRRTVRAELPRWAPFALIAVVHGAVFAGLLQVDSVRTQIVEAAPLMVSFITPPKPVEVTPPPAQVKPPTVEPRRIIAAARPSPSPIQAPPIVDTPIDNADPTPPAPPSPPVAVAVAAVTLPVPVTPPRFTGAGLDNAAAEYPLMSRRLKETGRVVLRVLVDPSGNADRIELAKSSGFERLDDSALSAVRRWRFLPATQGDQPIAQWVNVSIPFELTRS